MLNGKQKYTITYIYLREQLQIPKEFTIQVLFFRQVFSYAISQ